MNPFRLINPLYTLRLERTLADLTARADRLTLVVEAEHQRRRGYLMTIADAMATGRTNDAKVMVDSLVLGLGGKDAA
jgi:hypothetical protein